MYKHRYKIWICILVILSFFLGYDSFKRYNESIVPEDIYCYVDEELKESFLDITKNESTLQMKYKFCLGEEYSNANIILTSDITKINTKEEYEILGISPLIMAMKSSNDLNNFRTDNTKDGWIITSSQIKSKSDSINCDFKKVFDVVISGGDWSDLGGADEEIKIYCPDLNTQDGQTFKEFLVRIVKANENEIKKFFSSPNVIQTNVISRIEEIENNIPSNELYITLESDFLSYVYEFENEKNDLNLSFIYPKKAIVQHIYLQYNNADSELQEHLARTYFNFSELEGYYGIDQYFHSNNFYRDIEEIEYFDSDRFQKYSFQKGFNTFDYKIYVEIN